MSPGRKKKKKKKKRTEDNNVVLYLQALQPAENVKIWQHEGFSQAARHVNVMAVHRLSATFFLVSMTKGGKVSRCQTPSFPLNTQPTLLILSFSLSLLLFRSTQSITQRINDAFALNVCCIILMIPAIYFSREQTTHSKEHGQRSYDSRVPSRKMSHDK